MPSFTHSSEQNSNFHHTPREHFVVIEVTYSSSDQSDFATLSRIWREAMRLASKVNAAAAADAVTHQSLIKKFRNCLAGGFAEDAWIQHLNRKAGTVVACQKPFDESVESAVKQVDIQVGSKLTCEVRSSFIRNGIPFGLFSPKGFDILGRYWNAAKPGETAKDYYLRALYFGQPSSLCPQSEFEQLSDAYAGPSEIKVYLVGGATRAEMEACKDCKCLRELQGSEVWDSERDMLPKDTKYHVLPLREADDADLITARVLAAHRRVNR